MKGILLALALTVCTACAGTARPEAAPPPFDPVGVWDFTAEFEGQEIAGSLQIEGTRGAYAGRVTTAVGTEAVVRSVTIEGQRMVLMADTPDGPATIDATLDSDAFSGRWTLGGASGPIRGMRRR